MKAAAHGNLVMFLDQMVAAFHPQVGCNDRAFRGGAGDGSTHDEKPRAKGGRNKGPKTCDRWGIGSTLALRPDLAWNGSAFLTRGAL